MAPPQFKPLNPANVPTGGNMTYAALAPVNAKQLRFLDFLNRLAGRPPTWTADCHTILGKGWDGDFTHLSKAAASYLIYVLQVGLKATADPEDDLQIEGYPA